MRFSLASLLAGYSAGILPGENRQYLRRRPGLWYMQLPSRRFPLAAVQVIQDPVDGLRVLNAGNRVDRSTAPAAGLDVEFESPLQALRPGHSCMTFSRRTNFHT